MAMTIVRVALALVCTIILVISIVQSCSSGPELPAPTPYVEPVADAGELSHAEQEFIDLVIYAELPYESQNAALSDGRWICDNSANIKKGSWELKAINSHFPNLIKPQFWDLVEIAHATLC
jgi:hypothetical protein